MSKSVLFSSEWVSQGAESSQGVETMSHRTYLIPCERKSQTVVEFCPRVSNFRMNLTEKAVEYLKASDRALGCGFGDKNGQNATFLLKFFKSIKKKLFINFD